MTEPARDPADEPDRPTAAAAVVERVARQSYGRLVALLATPTRDLALAEDALADAFERALRDWPGSGVPDNPEGWLLTVARNRQRDALGSAARRTSGALDEEALRKLYRGLNAVAPTRGAQAAATVLR